MGDSLGDIAKNVVSSKGEPGGADPHALSIATEGAMATAETMHGGGLQIGRASISGPPTQAALTTPVDVDRLDPKARADLNKQIEAACAERTLDCEEGIDTNTHTDLPPHDHKISTVEERERCEEATEQTYAQLPPAQHPVTNPIKFNPVTCEVTMPVLLYQNLLNAAARQQ